MGVGESADPATPFAVLANVRCLECGEVYAKPVTGGTARMNPGCPTCGYVGWIPISLPPAEPTERRRSGESRLPTPHVRSG